MRYEAKIRLASEAEEKDQFASLSSMLLSLRWTLERADEKGAPARVMIRSFKDEADGV